MKVIYFFALVILAYCWVGYPVVLLILGSFINRRFIKADITPSVSIILTVYNEENIIMSRISNLMELDYPKDLLEIIVASDGSDDRTNEMVRNYKEDHIRLFVQDTNKGKSLTQNAAVRLASGEIVIFTDADAVFQPDFVKKVVRNFADTEVGCATGELTYLQEGENITTESLGFFWRYELLLRRLESRVGALFTVSGACMAVRKDLFKDIDPEYGDDCIVPLDTVLSGYNVVVGPDAKALVRNVSSPQAEFHARIRMTLRNWNGTLSRAELINPCRYPLYSFTIISHKFCRWLTPYFLLILCCSNIFILNNMFFSTLFGLQVIFYTLALLGFFLGDTARKYKLLSWPYAFCLSNFGILLGVWQALAKRGIVRYKNF